MVNICVERAENMTYFEVLPEADAYNFSTMINVKRLFSSPVIV
jgi:hypothetical protein